MHGINPPPIPHLSLAVPLPFSCEKPPSRPQLSVSECSPLKTTETKFKLASANISTEKVVIIWDLK